jgi:CBS domain-containing protein
MRTADIMTTNPVTVRPEDAVHQAATLMAEQDIGTVIVVLGERPVGILTDRDIALRVVGAGRSQEETPVGEIMTRNLVTCEDSLTVGDLVQQMCSERVRRIVVVDRTGTLVGIVSSGDIAQQLDGTEVHGRLLEAVTLP